MVVLLFLLHINGGILLQFASFLQATIYPNIPPVIMLGGLALLCAIAVRAGIEVLGRLAQLIIPWLMLMWGALLLLTIPDWNVAKLLPIMEHGIAPPLKGSTLHLGWYGQVFLLSFLLPYLDRSKRGVKTGVFTVVGIMITFTSFGLAGVFVFGATMQTMTFPLMDLVRYIRIGDFFQHLDAILLVAWVVGMFFQVAVWHFCFVTGTAQWLGLSNYRSLALPLGFLLLINSFWFAPTLPQFSHFVMASYPYYSTLVMYVIPLLLLLLATIRKKMGSGNTGKLSKGQVRQ